MTKQTRIGLIAAALILAGGGTAAVVAVVTGDEKPAAGTFHAGQPAEPAASSAAPSTEAAPAADGKRTITETEPIKFKTRTIKDNWLPKGEREKRTGGVDGVRTKTYEVTIVDGRETGRKLVKSEVTRKPVAEVIAVGTF